VTTVALASTERRSSARHVVLGLTLLLAAIVYLDRVAISTAAGGIKLGLGLSDEQLGWVFSVYTFAYALFEIPSGWLADRYGARWMLTRIVVAWSLMTAATGAASGLWSLLFVRFLFGVGEAGAFPAMARVHGRWLPTGQRGRSFGLLVMAGLLGSAFTQPLVVAMLTRMSWRWVFPIFGSVGLAWSAVWLIWFRDDPHRHRGVNAAELALIGAQAETAHRRVPWAALLCNSTVWILCLMYLGVIYGWYFYLTWLPQYLQRARGFDLKQTGWFAMLPLIGIALGVLSGGWASDLLVARFGEVWGRRLPGVIGLPLAAVAIVCAISTTSPRVAVLALTTAATLAAWGVAPGWAVCIDIGGRHAGVVSGAMNTFGNLGGALCSLVFGYCLGHWHSWSAPLWSMAAFYVFAGLCWTRVDASATLGLAEAA
jgi:ACS family glucarate transporter-like MFS transporter